MSNKGTDALARYEQLKGKAFLSAYEMLKGGGAITDIEGQKAGDAMARLNRAQSEDEAKQALTDFKEAVNLGVIKLRRAAGGRNVTPEIAPSGVVDFRTYFGGQ
jgi:flagellar protein FlgJ